MSMIQEYEDHLRDWQWYAMDKAGHIATFANGGLRRLPPSIRRDREVVERIERYFYEEALAISEWSVRPGAEFDAGWVDAKQRDHHLKNIAEMAIKGLFSYDTKSDRSPSAKYFLIALPQPRLTIDKLPDFVREAILQTRAPFLFEDTPYIPEAMTLEW